MHNQCCTVYMPLQLCLHPHPAVVLPLQAQELPCKLDLAVYIEHIKDRSEWSTYPNNAMRNRALALATTEVWVHSTCNQCAVYVHMVQHICGHGWLLYQHAYMWLSISLYQPPPPTHSQVVLLLDSDFVPGPLQWNMALVQDNTTHQQVVQMLGNGSNVAVLSALDTNSTSLTSLYDHHAWARRALQYGTKPNLSQWIEEGHVVQFQDFGHAETNWSRWKDAQEAYSVEYKTFDGVWPSEVCAVYVCVWASVGCVENMWVVCRCVDVCRYM